MEKFNLNSSLKKFGAAALAAMILFAGGAAGSYIATRYTVTEAGISTATNPGGAAVASTPTAYDQRNPYVAIVKRSSPAVVNIDVETMVTEQPMVNPFQGNPFFEEFFGEEFFGPQQRQSQPRKVPRRGKGSGFIVSKEGYILTNNHVVEDADKIKVTMLDGRTFDAKKVGQDPTFDLAVIQIKAKDLPVLQLGDSSATEVGEQVVAIGNPHGFENTVTAGIISAKNRTLQAPEINFQGFLQTDAAINPGNSGGPLIDLNGNVIGINTAIVPYAQGIGFAIPVNMAKQIMDDLIKHGEVRRGWLGVTVQPLTASLVEAYKIPTNEGSIVADVQKGSPAEKFGLKRGDVIISVGDSKVKNSEDVVFAVRNRMAGEKVTFEIYRDGKKMTVEVTLGDMDSVPGARRQSGSSRGGQQNAPKESTQMGITVVLNTPEFSKQYELSETGGVVVTKIAQGSQGQRLGLRPGDVILEINRQKINSIADWERMMSAKKGALGFLVSRDGQTLFISVGK
ncbi:MAG: Do family serine endopeptidase [Synergistaceae bacterium]|nr:Do family serine endopeptidase [Synergistaceae bacterium]